MPQIILIEKSAVFPVTPARLYKSLTEPKELARWLADRVESDPRVGGQILIDYGTHEKRGEYRRLIRGAEVGIRWLSYEEPVPEDLTGFKIEKVTNGTRVRVVDFATPEDADEHLALWTQRFKRLRKLYAAKSAPKKAAPRKTLKRKTASKKKTGKRSSSIKRAAK
jgi:uncharacterized protein YndB with AHSA1/START domain